MNLKQRKRLITSMLFGLVGLSAMAQADPSRPKLFVGIVIDQLRTDYLDHLRQLFGQKGFNRLMRDGLFMRDLDFSAADLDRASATALLYTGSFPASTGVPSGETYNPTTRKMVPALSDPAAMGNFTGESYSPTSLRLSTISDEIAVDGAGLGAVYSIASDPSQAVIMAGHAANAALWINDMTGKWCSSTYYKDFPQTVANRNYRTPLSTRVDTMQWKPSLPLDSYKGVPAQKKYYPFRYTFPSNDKDVYKRYIASPLANAEVTDVAISVMESLKLGKRGDVIDMINVGYTAAPFKYVKDSDFRLELQDTYLRLDAQIARLLDEVDRSVGLENAFVWVTSTGYYDDAAPEDASYRIPTGDFSLKRAVSLLNAYMSAKYGNADYVSTIAGPYIYLDHSTLEKRGVDLHQGVAEARDFIRRMSGVEDAFTLDEILAGTDPELGDIRRATDRKTAGDIYLKINPGWNRIDDLTYPSTTSVERTGMAGSPAFILSPLVEAAVINTPVEAVALAPTVMSLLHIRSPNGAVRRPLQF